MNAKRFTAMRQCSAAATTLTLLLAATGAGWEPANASAVTGAARQTSSDSKFYCNMKALNPAERALHQQLTEKLIAARKEIVEMPRGYEFQYRPSGVSV